jgi:hypothetical protein
MSNEVVGIISFSLIEGQNLNFAISISNLSSLFEVNTLIFPDAPKQPQKLDKGFKRFDWDTYSSTVKTNEELKFKEKVDKHDQKEFSLDYVASIGNIDIDISYNFEFDKLRQIKFCPIICLTKKGITDCKWYYPSDFQVAYSNFVSLQEKIIDLLGDDYVELWWKLNSLTKKTSDILNSDVITKNQIETYNNINLLREKILTADDKFRMFGVVHRWNSEINKSTYEISLFHSDFNVLGLEDAEHKWTCTLSVKPLEE